MVHLTIDNQPIEVPEGTTVLQAARQLGLDIPALCWAEGFEPSTSCMCCVVRINGAPHLSPSCATVVRDGMVVESETEPVRAARRNALELLLSDHAGDCLAPCQRTCPTDMEVPEMMRRISAGDFHGAIGAVKRDMALPAVLGYVCSRPCEAGCRRSSMEVGASICELHRFVAEIDLAAPQRYQPPKEPATGRHVAIVGSGPTGLSAAWHLLQRGHACTIFDRHDQPGGSLRRQLNGDELPRHALEGEIEAILQLGAEFRGEVELGSTITLESLLNDFDAVLLATGIADEQSAAPDGVPMRGHRAAADRATFATDTSGLFAGGGLLRGKAIAARAVADGKLAAENIDRYLHGGLPIGARKPFDIRMGKLQTQELVQLSQGVTDPPDAALLAGPMNEHRAVHEAGLCLHCDCHALEDCKLRRYAEQYEADPKRFGTPRPAFEQISEHDRLIHEPGKCIRCGLCVQVARREGEAVGLTFVGRGYEVRIAPPLSSAWADAITRAAEACAKICPTGALSLRDDAGSRQSAAGSASVTSERR
jgi:ferredoxin